VIRKRLFRFVFMGAIAILSISVLVATACKSPGSSNPKGANSEAGSPAEATNAIVPTIELSNPKSSIYLPAMSKSRTDPD
jgi:hypothetical protein